MTISLDEPHQTHAPALSLGLRWAEWLERRATSGPRPLRIPFEAELAFEAWVESRWSAERRRRAARTAGDALGLAGRELADVLLTLVGVVVPLAWSSARRLRQAATTHGSRAVSTIEARDQRHLSRTIVAASSVLTVIGVAAASAVPATAAARRQPVQLAARAGLERAPVTPPDDAPAPAPAATPAPPAAPPAAVSTAVAVPAVSGALPVGKGMWIWHPEQTEGGDPNAIVARAEAVGLTHVYVWLGSSVSGIATRPFLDAFLPVAHAHGLRVYGWDFPYLDNADADVDRAVDDITHTAPSGDRLDGFAADVELRSMGVNISPLTAAVYTSHLRSRVGPAFPLIAVVPRPNPALIDYPFAEMLANFDAVAPMVYWLGGDPVAQLTGAVQVLSQFHKPILPIGQAYDGFDEGGPHGVPPRDQLLAFMHAADSLGAAGVSWWSWQHADQQAWDAVRDAPEFVMTPKALDSMTPGQIRAFQVLLSSLGFPITPTGVWDAKSAAAIRAYQWAAHIPATGQLDATTRRLLFTPFAIPIRPAS